MTRELGEKEQMNQKKKKKRRRRRRGKDDEQAGEEEEEEEEEEAEEEEEQVGGELDHGPRFELQDHLLRPSSSIPIWTIPLNRHRHHHSLDSTYHPSIPTSSSSSSSRSSSSNSSNISSSCFLLSSFNHHPQQPHHHHHHHHLNPFSHQQPIPTINKRSHSLSIYHDHHFTPPPSTANSSSSSTSTSTLIHHSPLQSSMKAQDQQQQQQQQQQQHHHHHQMHLQNDKPHHPVITPLATSSGSKKDKPGLLTQEQKRANHIASEQKRRAAIRLGYTRLCSIVPSLRASSLEGPLTNPPTRSEDGHRQLNQPIDHDQSDHTTTGTMTPNSSISHHPLDSKRKRNTPHPSIKRPDAHRPAIAANKSEAVVLAKTVEYLRELESERRSLIERLKSLRSISMSQGIRIEPNESTAGIGSMERSSIPEDERADRRPIWASRWTGNIHQLDLQLQLEPSSSSSSSQPFPP